MSNVEEFYAYPEPWRGLEAIMRFHSVKRWHMIDTTRQQTLAEHSANVALLAFYIATTAPVMYFGAPAMLAAMGMLHDLPEVFTGDAPTMTKKHIEGLNELEKKVLPPEFTYKVSDDHPSKKLVKICDLADGIRFIAIHGVGATAKHAENGLMRQLTKLQEATKEEWPNEVYNYVFSVIYYYTFEIELWIK